MGVNRSSLSRAMHGQQRVRQRAPAPQRAPARQAAPGPHEVTVSRLSDPRPQKAGVYEQTIYGTYLNKINRPNGVRVGAVQLPVIAVSSDGQQLVVRVLNPQGIQVTEHAKLFLTGNRDGTLHTWVFGPGQVGSRDRFRFSGDPCDLIPFPGEPRPAGCDLVPWPSEPTPKPKPAGHNGHQDRWRRSRTRTRRR